MPSKTRVSTRTQGSFLRKKEAQHLTPRTKTEVNADPMSEAPGPNHLRADTKPAANQPTTIQPTAIKTLRPMIPGSNQTRKHLGDIGY